VKTKAEQAGESFDDQRFGDAGDAFKKDVALNEEGHEGFIDDAGLAGDDAAELGAGVIEELAGGVEFEVSGGFVADWVVCFLGHALLQ